MKHTGKFHTNQFSSFLTEALYSLILVVGLAACGGGGSNDPDPIPDQDPSGLYRMGTGTIGAINVTELNAFVYDGRILAFSMPARLLIDGTIDTVNEDNYTATIKVYVDGVLDQADVPVTGKVTNGSSISGTLNGTGNGSGNFSITYDLLYERGATVERIDTPTSDTKSGNVVVVVDNMATNNFKTGKNNDDDDTYSFQSLVFESTVIECLHAGEFTIPDSVVNLYKVAGEVSNTAVDCDSSLVATDYTGFMAVVDGVSTDDTVLYAVTNSTRSVSAILTD